MNKIIVEPYNKNWKIEFNKAYKFYNNLLKDIDVQIEHVGSTSIKGLMAKPILDIDIIVNNDIDSKRVIDLLETVGYTHRGNLGIEGREAFSYQKDNKNISWIDHHLYVCLKNCDNLKNHLLLRNYLKNNPEAIVAYSELKCSLAKKYPYDIDLYVEGKTSLITSFLEACGMDNDVLNKIVEINKK
jgi:GrpB-like predicted nucleotidyltransferase (UPF0157 family)